MLGFVKPGWAWWPARCVKKGRDRNSNRWSQLILSRSCTKRIQHHGRGRSRTSDRLFGAVWGARCLLVPIPIKIGLLRSRERKPEETKTTGRVGKK